MQHLSSSGELPHNASCFLHYYDLQLFAAIFPLLENAKLLTEALRLPVLTNLILSVHLR